MRSRGIWFAAVVTVMLVVAGGYVAYAVVRSSAGGAPGVAPTGTAFASEPYPFARRVLDAPADAAGAYGLLFQKSTRLQMATIVDGRVTESAEAPLSCNRVHYSGGAGLCLQPHRWASEFQALLFGPDFKVRATFNLGGITSRARVSSDGRYGATTGFVSGHSYADDNFSTSTTIIDLKARKVVADLETFRVTRDGRSFSSVDFNFWGVTFARNSDRFYATLGTRGKTYLVVGSVSARSARVMKEGVECPSLSPDGTRVAFKKQVAKGRWRLHVLRLSDLDEWPISETRSVDDQVEWLDDETLLYGLRYDTWSARADGGGEPRLIVPDGMSPAALRT